MASSKELTNSNPLGLVCEAKFDQRNCTISAITLRLYLQPKASRDAFVGLHNHEMKVTVTAAPVDGQANSHLVKFLSKQFKTAKSQITIEKGELSRHKQVRIEQPKVIPEVILSLMDHN
ncbi:DUF167 family protein YggU [Motilimonas sp. KMU-193]|uniref:DUF167 family protein YggU n=1 Tax=Motilimonas sp. KMU-193 TaxID=3388668 RepID=UPI00396B1DE4